MNDGERPELWRRREVLKAALGLGALATGSVGVESKERTRFEIVKSTLTSDRLRSEIETMVNTAVDKFWDDPTARTRILEALFDGEEREQINLENRNEVERALVRRSKLTIPTETEPWFLLRDYPEQLAEFVENIPMHECGFFVAGDYQKIYLIKNIGGGKFACEVSCPVTTSKEDWSNIPDSDGTSLGLHWISEKRDGILGEIISEKDKKGRRHHFGPPVRTRKGEKLIVKSFKYTGGQLATVVTKGLLLWNPVYGSTRGELLHGTNREDVLGQRASGGCTRLGIDILYFFERAKKMALDAKGNAVGGTPVMIAAKGRKPTFGKPRSNSQKQPNDPKSTWDWEHKF